MQITILGCGNSHGVPCINCSCFVCESGNIKNKRKRASIFIEHKDTKILIDTSPDLRQQCLENNIREIDAVMYTHDHSDHVAGIDDIRRLCKDKKPIDAYIDDNTFKNLNKRYSYIFNETSSLYYPLLKRRVLKPFQKIGDINVSSFDQMHGSIISQGIRLENIAYSTDFNEMPEEAFEKLENLDVWILDCMRYSYAPTHSYLEKSLLLIERVKPKLAILTHMAHEIEYDEISKILPKNVIAAYDNLKI